MIARLHRFHGQSGLRAVYRHGQTTRSPHLSLKYLQRPAGRRYRVAIVVSRKVSKSAVVRNRIRRRLYEAVRAYHSGMSGEYDMVITVFNEQVAGIDASSLEKMVRSLLSKARIVA
jgi:ribonuclease P protein component